MGPNGQLQQVQLVGGGNPVITPVSLPSGNPVVTPGPMPSSNPVVTPGPVPPGNPVGPGNFVVQQQTGPVMSLSQATSSSSTTTTQVHISNNLKQSN